MDFALAAPLGLIVGSFLNVVAYRVPRGESLAWPGSHCPACQAPIRPRDNVPLLSWALLRGRCRDCASPISVRYPAVELVTALVFAAIVVVRGLNAQLAWELPLAATLIAIASVDLEHRIVPNRVLAPLALWGVAASALVRLEALPTLLAAGAGAFLAFLALALIHPAGMGMGDVKLAGVLGLYLGFSVLPALIVAFLTGSIVGVAVVARSRGKPGKPGVPFAPFLALGGVVAILAGPELIGAYQSAFLH